MITIRIVLCMTVGWFMSWNSAVEKRNELMFKKHVFVIRTNSFPFNDFQEINGILENPEIVGIKIQHEKFEAGVEHNFSALAEISAEKIFQKKPPDLGGIMWREPLYQ